MQSFRCWLWATPMLLAGCASSNPDRSLPTNFSELTLSVAGGYVMQPDSASDCSAPFISYKLDQTTRQLGWDGCYVDANSSPSTYKSHSDSRILSQDEFSSVLSEFDKVQIGSRNTCGADMPLMTLDLTVGGRTSGYIDDFYSGCDAATRARANPEGRTWVMYLGNLTAVLEKLSRI